MTRGGDSFLCFDAANASSKRTERDIRAFELGNSVFNPARFNYLPVGRLSQACQRMGLTRARPRRLILCKTTIKPLLGEVLRCWTARSSLSLRGYMGLAGRPTGRWGVSARWLHGAADPS